MRYYLTNFSIQTYPFVTGMFEEALSKHLVANYREGRELVQVWHTCQSKTANRDFDYFNVLWKGENEVPA